jgi:ketosteroid isomerase-like protein
MVPTDLATLADGFFAAIEAGDFARLEALLAEDCEVHANFLDAPNDRTRTLAILRWLHDNVRDLRYDVVRRDELPDGYVQQHVLRGIAPDGSELRVPACLIVSIRDGRITRIDEYLDSAHTRALTGR